MSAASTSIVIGIVTTGMAGLVGFMLFKLITDNWKAIFPDDYGRKWLAWAVFFSTLVALPKFFRLLDVDSFAVWLLALVVFGSIAYILGLIIGRMGQKKLSEYSNERAFSDPEEEAIYDQVAIEIDNGEIHQGLWIKATTESDGSEFQAKAIYAKFRVNQLKREAEEARKEQLRAQERERKNNKLASCIKNWETTTVFPMPTNKNSPSKSHPLTFSKIVVALRTAFEQYPDKRTGDNVIYSMTDAGMGAFAFNTHQKWIPMRKWRLLCFMIA